MLKKFNSAKVPAAPFYSHAAEVSTAQRMLFIAGQVGQRLDGSVPSDMAEQTRVAVENVQAVLAEAGMTVADVAKYTIYLTDEKHMEGFMAAAAPLLSSPPAATTLLFVKALAAPTLFIEIEAVAVK